MYNTPGSMIPGIYTERRGSFRTAPESGQGALLALEDDKSKVGASRILGVTLRDIYYLGFEVVPTIVPNLDIREDPFWSTSSTVDEGD